MTKLPLFLMLVCGVALVFVAGPRLTTDTAAVIIGVVVGIGASVPVSLLLVALLSRKTASYAPAALGRARPSVAPPAPPAAPVPLTAPRRGPLPVAADKVRAHLGPDLGGVPLDLDFGGTDAAGNLLVVNAPDVFFIIAAAAEQAGWPVEPVAAPADLARWTHVCQARQARREAQPRVILVLEDLADLLMDDPRQGQEANRRLYYLTSCGPAVGLHVLAGAQHPDVLQELYLCPWPVRIAGPGPAVDLAAALGLSAEVAAELTAPGVHWLCVHGNVFGFHPTGDSHGS